MFVCIVDDFIFLIVCDIIFLIQLYTLKIYFVYVNRDFPRGHFHYLNRRFINGGPMAKTTLINFESAH